MTATAGAMLRSARTSRRLAQQAVAVAAGISQPQVSALETGVRRVGPGVAARLAPVLGLSAADLLKAAGLAGPRVLTVRSHRDIPAVCPCDWRMAFVGERPAGWDLATVRPWCPCHGNGSTR